MQNQKKKKKKVNTCFSAIHLLNDPQGTNMVAIVVYNFGRCSCSHYNC